MVHPSVHHLPLPFGGVAPSTVIPAGRLKVQTQVVLLNLALTAPGLRFVSAKETGLTLLGVLANGPIPASIAQNLPSLLRAIFPTLLITGGWTWIPIPGGQVIVDHIAS